jgi:hypothetical protein|tara:strand:- start:2907 stop:3473 length:567 start_codon:yes stop_codon:yes gene_type:complete
VQKVVAGLAIFTDIQDILCVQRKNLASAVSDDEKARQGFVTLETSEELLGDIISNEGIIVARCGNKLAGYLIPITVRRSAIFPLFLPLAEQFRFMRYDGRVIDMHKVCILAQICIDKEFRNGESLQAIHQVTRNHLGKKYDIGVALISSTNPRSLAANTKKAGMTDVGQYVSRGITWHVVVSDFRATS